MKHTPLVLIAAAAACTLTSITLAGGYDAAADFDPINNPGGVWSYGSTLTLGGAFTLHVNSGVTAGFDYWSAGPVNASGLINPSTFHNATASTITYGGSAEIHPGQMNMHPGQLGEFAVTRFTAPSAGLYNYSAIFTGEDFIFPTTTDVHLVVNNSSTFDSLINGFHTSTGSGPLSVYLQAGGTIDVVVGWGVNGTYTGDSTGVSFTVDLAPTPGAAAALGLGGLVALRRRR